jgi:hypothetical protein
MDVVHDSYWEGMGKDEKWELPYSLDEQSLLFPSPSCSPVTSTHGLYT